MLKTLRINSKLADMSSFVHLNFGDSILLRASDLDIRIYRIQWLNR